MLAGLGNERLKKREWYLANRAACIARATARNSSMKEERSQYMRRYAAENRERGREIKREYKKRKPWIDVACVKRRRCSKAQRTPKWADHEEIKAIYREAALLTKKTGVKHHVDHVVPLKGKTVSGLHVEYNLRAIPAVENLKKANRLTE